MSRHMHGPPPHLAVPVSWRSPKLPWQLSHWACWEKQVSLGRIPEINSDFKEVAWAAATRICQIVTGSPLSVWQGQKSWKFLKSKVLATKLPKLLRSPADIKQKEHNHLISQRADIKMKMTQIPKHDESSPSSQGELNGPKGRSHLSRTIGICQSSSSISTVKGSPDPIRSFNLRFCRMKVHYSRNHHEHDI